MQTMVQPVRHRGSGDFTARIRPPSANGRLGQIDLNAWPALNSGRGGVTRLRNDRRRSFQRRTQGKHAMSEDKAKQIAALNDLFRLNFPVPTFGPRPVPGHIVCTRGILPRLRKPRSASGPKCRVSTASRKAMTPTPNAISEPSACRECPRRFSGRSTITLTNPARPALKTLPTRRGASACSPSCWHRSIHDWFSSRVKRRRAGLCGLRACSRLWLNRQSWRPRYCCVRSCLSC